MFNYPHPRVTLVAPPAGAWIETYTAKRKGLSRDVAPPAGTWIETYFPVIAPEYPKSLPLRERGLKQLVQPVRQKQR